MRAFAPCKRTSNNRLATKAPYLAKARKLSSPTPRSALFRGRLLLLAAMSAAFPTPAERNRQLARRLKEACSRLKGGGTGTYGGIKSKAAEFRAGRADAQELCREFFAALGRTAETEELYCEMAELLPTPQQYGELMDALRSMQSRHSQRQQREQEKETEGSSTGASGARAAAASSHLAAAAAAAALRGIPAAPSRPPLMVLQEEEGTHPNSQSSRPAKPLPAVKRVRSSSGPSAGAKLPAASEGTQGSGGRGAGILVWLRQDLRVHDNPTLCAAAADAAAMGSAVTFVYVHSPLEDGDDPGDAGGASWRPGGASLLWLDGALRCLDADLKARYGLGAGLLYRHGPAAQALLEVAAAVGAGRVYFSRRYEPAMQATDERVHRELEAAGLMVRSFAGFLLREPAAVRLDMGKWAGHFGTLMPFYRACEALGPISGLLGPPASLPVAESSPADRHGGPSLDELGLARMPVRRDGTAVDWGAPIRAAWRDFGEAAAHALLERFIAVGLARYESDRGFADGRCVSRLSPYLHFGQISPRFMLHRLGRARCQQVSKTFWRRLVWRDLAYWQLHHWPRMAAQPIREHYAAQEWAHDPTVLAAWQRGATGFPLVDAGMRELWATGWMHQNARMAVACLLTEYLGLHWVEGARWFHDTLVDADLAINSMMWQNAGKSGLDQWNFTVLPTSKAQDPNGAYIRRWVPELAHLPAQYMHEPWKAPPAVLATAGVVLGETYPYRVAARDLQELRAENSAAIKAARAAGGPGCYDAGGYDLVTVPQGATLGHDGQRMRVFTKPEYRSNGPEAEGAEGAGGGQRRRAAAGGRRGAAGRAQESVTGVSAGQRTLMEYMSRAK